MGMIEKRKIIEDKKYRDSFKTLHNHHCVIMDIQSTEYGVSVVGCHISFANYARGKKASDDLIIPLVDVLHKEMDKNQPDFWREHGEYLDIDPTGLDDHDLMDKVKDWARQYYQNWLDLQN